MKKNKKASIYKNTIATEIVKYLYKDVSGIKLSAEYRSKLGDLNGKQLTYGEIVSTSFLQILELVAKLNNQENIHNRSSNKNISYKSPLLEFVDLGCGTGKPVYCAALSSISFQKCWGIEIVPTLVEVANIKLQLLHKIIDQSLTIKDRNTNSMVKSCTSNSLTPIPSSSSQLKTSKTKKQSTAMTLPTFITEIMKIIESHQHSSSPISMTIEYITNLFCKQYNHKIYKESLKNHGSFTKFITKVTIHDLYPEYVLSYITLTTGDKNNTNDDNKNNTGDITLTTGEIALTTGDKNNTNDNNDKNTTISSNNNNNNNNSNNSKDTSDMTTSNHVFIIHEDIVSINPIVYKIRTNTTSNTHDTGITINDIANNNNASHIDDDISTTYHMSIRDDISTCTSNCSKEYVGGDSTSTTLCTTTRDTNIDTDTVLKSQIQCYEDSNSYQDLLHICQSMEFHETILPLCPISFIVGSIYEINWWSTADIIYVASLLFTDTMMIELVECIYHMKVGSWIITLKPLPVESVVHVSTVTTTSTTTAIKYDENISNGQDDANKVSNDNDNDNAQNNFMITHGYVNDDLYTRKYIQLRHESFFKMSWQMAKVYIYQITLK